MLVCPYCGQDDIWKVHFESIGVDALMCVECDTVWDVQEAVMDGSGLNLDSYMAKRGKKADWKTITKLEKATSSP